jgi:hypothetical protein
LRTAAGSDFEAERQNGVANSLFLGMSNPSSDVHHLGEALEERLRTGGAGTDQPQDFTGTGALGGRLQRTQFIGAWVVQKIVFHAS